MVVDAIPIPPLYHIRQVLPSAPPIDVEAVLESEWDRLSLSEQVVGKQIALGFGSRGVAKIDIIARKLVALVQLAGGDPFIVPAMGSHGGAIAEGQIDVLAHLGITEAFVGCPIRATMDVVDVGETKEGFSAYMDRNVAEADGFMVVNRIKVHTDFHGAHESGLLKMIAIGLGKERGASTFHRYGVRGLRDNMPIVAQHLIRKLNFIAGFGTVEDGYHRPVCLEGLTKETIISGEQRLLEYSRGLMPSLPIDQIDVLVIDEMGKDISGAGMDSNIIGRWLITGEPEPAKPTIKRIAVLDLTEASHGNATAYGFADFMSRRLFDKIDFQVTVKNLFTSGFMQRARMPLFLDTDRETIQAAIYDALRVSQDFANVRFMRIKNTLEIENLWVSANLLDELRGNSNITIASDAHELKFIEGQLF